MEPMIQAERRTREGLSPVIASRSGLSTTAAHGDAEPRPAEEDVEGDRREQRDQDDDQLVPPDVDVEHLERVGVEEAGERVADVPVPEVADPDDDEDQADRRDDLDRRAHRGQRPRHALEDQTLDRRHHEQADEGGPWPRHVVLDVEEVEDEDRERRERAISEVEDPGGLVRQDQPDAGQAVDRADRDPDDHERQDVVPHQAIPLCPVGGVPSLRRFLPTGQAGGAGLRRPGPVLRSVRLWSAGEVRAVGQLVRTILDVPHYEALRHRRLALHVGDRDRHVAVVPGRQHV